MPISDWPRDDRPREKLLQKGAEALSDAELVAIFLRTGIRGKSAVDLARGMLARYGSLTRLLAAAATLKTNPGVGAAKSSQLQAARELSRRALREAPRSLRAMSIRHRQCGTFFA